MRGWADQRFANAEVAVLVSRALPKDIDTFGHIDGVWIADPRFAIPLAIALRQTLIEVANTRQAQAGSRDENGACLPISDRPEVMDREKRAMTRLWAKREAQIQGVIESTVGMHGDLQGIAGRALQEIKGLEVPLLEDGKIEEPVE
jgi:hypothetical protein